MSHSQFNEFEIIRELLPNLDNGIYIDIGAGHPVQFSNTYDLYLLGWHGICIEPQTKFVEQLKQARPKDIVIHTAISNFIGTALLYGGEFYCTLEKGYFNACSKVPVTTFDTILQQYLDLCRQCNICNVDVDHHEDKAFEEMDLSLFHPNIFIVESVPKYKKGIDTEELWENKLFDYGYKRVASSKVPVNYFYMVEK